MLLVAPPPPPSAPATAPREAAATRTTRAVSEINLQFQAPSHIPRTIATADDGPQPSGVGIGIPGSIGDGNSIGSLLSGNIQPTVVVRPPAPEKPHHVSSGVIDGYIVNKTPPTYPAIARAARIQGSVVLAAVISKNGTIEKLHVISGPQMLQQSALDAVSTWRYKPYLLNGEPVEVETQVNVIFNLGN